MLDKINLKIIIVTFYCLININLTFSSDNDFKPINKLITSLKLEIEYDYFNGQIKIFNNKNKIIFLLDSPYILFDTKKFYINNFIKSEQGQIYIPNELVNMINIYFKENRIDSLNKQKLNKQKNNLTNIKDNFYLNIKKNNKEEPNYENKEEFKNIIYDKDNTEIDIKNKYFFKEKQENIKIKAIIIDPGHGGSDPGAVGFSGTKEKDIVLQAALILQDKLMELFPNKKIILTRESDIFLSLEKRAKIANYVFDKYGQSLFISLHVNASRSKKSYGFETWYLVEELRRNIIKKGELTEDKDVENVLNSMLNDEIYKESKYLATIIQNNIENEIGYISKNRGIKEQIYFVIKKSVMPAVLIEMGFNTNKYEEIRLTKYEYLNKVTQGIKKGVEDFIYEFEKTLGFTK